MSSASVLRDLRKQAAAFKSKETAETADKWRLQQARKLILAAGYVEDPQNPGYFIKK